MSRVYPLRIANQIYEYDFQQETPRKPSRQKSNNNSRKSKGRNPGGKSSKNNGGESGQGIELPEVLVPKKQTIKYNFGDFILSFLPCVKRRKDVFVQKVIDTARKDIYLLEIVKKLHEFDRLKRILLDEDELKLLSYQKLPVIREQDYKLDETAIKKGIVKKECELEKGKSKQVELGLTEKSRQSIQKSKEPSPSLKQNRILEGVAICNS